MYKILLNGEPVGPIWNISSPVYRGDILNTQDGIILHKYEAASGAIEN